MCIEKKTKTNEQILEPFGPNLQPQHSRPLGMA